MTLTATSYTPLLYNGDGATVSFSVTFQFYELLVTHIDANGTETTWTENTHYTVTGGAGATGSVVVSTSPTDYTPASGEQLRIERNTAQNQTEDFDLDNQVTEDSLQSSIDKIAMVMQELTYNNNRRPALSKAAFAALGGAIEFPAPSALKALGWNSAGDALENIALIDLDGVAISALSTISSLASGDKLVVYDVSAGDNVAISRDDLAADLAPSAATEFSDAAFRIQDNADATKELAFEVSGLSTATTRTITPLDEDMTLVGLTNTQTLTNKTLTTPTLTSPVLNTAVSGTAVLDEDDMSSDSSIKLATQQSIKAYVDGKSVPAGSVMAWLTATAPTGYLECNGAAISRTTYADLFAVISDDYGNGDGSTTFNLPDFRGEFLRGWDHAAGNDPDAASRTNRGDGTTGDNVGTKQADELEAHTHTTPTSDGLGGGGTSSSVNKNDGVTGSTGGNETRPRNVNVMWIIKY